MRRRLSDCIMQYRIRGTSCGIQNGTAVSFAIQGTYAHPSCLGPDWHSSCSISRHESRGSDLEWTDIAGVRYGSASEHTGLGSRRGGRPGDGGVGTGPGSTGAGASGTAGGPADLRGHFGEPGGHGGPVRDPGDIRYLRAGRPGSPGVPGRPAGRAGLSDARLLRAASSPAPMPAGTAAANGKEYR